MSKDQWIIDVEQAGERWIEDGDDEKYLATLVRLGFSLGEAQAMLKDARA